MNESRYNKVQASDDVFIKCESTITMKFHQGKSYPIGYYRVLHIFSKYYKNWFVQMESDKIIWGKYCKKYNIPSRLMHKGGVEFKEVELEKYGHWGPRDVFFINHICEVVSVNSKLEDNC